MQWFIEAGLGAAAAVLIQLFAQTRSFYIAGLVPLFPTLALISHTTPWVRSEPRRSFARPSPFGMVTVVPYLVYLAALYVLVSRFRLIASLPGATAGAS